jgi:hypothetical protein
MRLRRLRFQVERNRQRLVVADRWLGHQIGAIIEAEHLHNRATLRALFEVLGNFQFLLGRDSPSPNDVQKCAVRTWKRRVHLVTTLSFKSYFELKAFEIWIVHPGEQSSP